MKKLKYVLTSALLGLGLLSGAALAGDAKQKVIYHINGDDPKQQAAAVGNIQNHINAVGAENLDLRVVMHGDGLSLLLPPEAVARTKMKAGNADPQMQAKIDNLRSQGVKFKVCANTLKGRQVNVENDLYMVDKEDIVTSGVAELAILQAQGFTYIKP